MYWCSYKSSTRSHRDESSQHPILGDWWIFMAVVFFTADQPWMRRWCWRGGRTGRALSGSRDTWSSVSKLSDSEQATIVRRLHSRMETDKVSQWDNRITRLALNNSTTLASYMVHIYEYNGHLVYTLQLSGTRQLQTIPWYSFLKLVTSEGEFTELFGQYKDGRVLIYKQEK